MIIKKWIGCFFSFTFLNRQFSQQFYYMFHLPIAKCIANQYVQYVWTCGCLSWIAMKLKCMYMNSPLLIVTQHLSSGSKLVCTRFRNNSGNWDFCNQYEVIFEMEKRQNVWKTLLPIRNDTGGPTFNVLKAGKC